MPAVLKSQPWGKRGFVSKNCVLQHPWRSLHISETCHRRRAKVVALEPQSLPGPGLTRCRY